MFWGHRFKAPLVAVALGAAIAVAPPAGAGDLGLKLTLGRAVFWGGHHFDDAAVGD